MTTQGRARSLWLQVGLAAFLAWTVAFAASMAPVFERFEWASWDWRVQWLATPSDHSKRIRLVLIDQQSLDWASDVNQISWPWPRQAYEPLLGFLERAGAELVVFDMLFTEPSSYGVSDDSRLAEALQRAPPSVGAVALGNGQPLRLDELPSDRLLSDRGSPARVGHLPPAERLVLPIPPLEKSFDRLGNVHVQPDADSVFRRLAPYRLFRGEPMPSLATAAWELLNPDSGWPDIPVDAQGRGVLHFRGDVGLYEPLSAASLIQSELRLRQGRETALDPRELEGQIVMIAPSAAGLLDLGATPMSSVSPRVLVHATALDNLLGGDWMHTTPRLWLAFYLALLAFGVALATRYLHSLWQTLIILALCAGLPWVLAVGAYQAGLWLPLIAPTLAAFIAFALTLFWNYMTEGRQRRFIKQAFQQYLSPAVIERLVSDPQRLTLGGEARELTLLFSDIQGFTSVAESLSAERLTELLNNYLSAMTDIILDTGGTIDKYEGDAIIAFWNAPLDQPNHAALGVEAMLNCHAQLEARREDWASRYGPELHVRIGVNTGEVVVGNMGSSKRFDYTFLGDAGNLAARLEGANKVFGSELMISAATRAQLPDSFRVRELGRILVVGRAEPITVYEPWRAQRYQMERDTLQQFERGLEAYYRGHIERAQTLWHSIADRDPPARAYLTRCRELPSELPADWDGTWQLTDK